MGTQIHAVTKERLKSVSKSITDIGSLCKIRFDTYLDISEEFFLDDLPQSLTAASRLYRVQQLVWQAAGGVPKLLGLDEHTGSVTMVWHDGALLDGKALQDRLSDILTWVGKLWLDRISAPEGWKILRLYAGLSIEAEMQEAEAAILALIDNDPQARWLIQQCRIHADYLTELDPVPVHRDLQSSNILTAHEQFYVLDLQDMCLGPWPYDIATIVFDAKLELGWDEREGLIRRAVAILQPFFNRVGIQVKNPMQLLYSAGIVRTAKCIGRAFSLQKPKAVADSRISHLQTLLSQYPMLPSA